MSKNYLFFILLAVFLFQGTIGYAQIKKIDRTSFTLEFKRRLNQVTLWLEEYIHHFKNVIQNLKTQHKDMKKMADESKRMMKKEMQQELKI